MKTIIVTDPRLPEITGVTTAGVPHWTIQVAGARPKKIYCFLDGGRPYWSWHDKRGKLHMTDAEPIFSGERPAKRMSLAPVPGVVRGHAEGLPSKPDRKENREMSTSYDIPETERLLIELLEAAKGAKEMLEELAAANGVFDPHSSERYCALEAAIAKVESTKWIWARP